MKLLFLLALLVVLWAAGLWAFAERVAASTPAGEPPAADGVVALTGGSVVRLEAAEQLLEDGKARRLLISGVNPQVTRPQVKEAARGVGRKWDCCVDLGFRAENTRGNAQETAAWARHNAFRSLIVVTADYHMPRAVLELGARMRGVRLRPYPVVTDLDARRWWRTGTGVRRMALEYCKYLAILGREAVLALGRRLGVDTAHPPARVTAVGGAA